MDLNEAYKKLDLVEGLGIESVESQYRMLKDEIQGRISTTKNEKLYTLYQNRSVEIEEAYAVLKNHFNQIQKENQLKDLPNPTPEKQETEEAYVQDFKLPAQLFAIPVNIGITSIIWSLIIFIYYLVVKFIL
jgi:hypothetical protein